MHTDPYVSVVVPAYREEKRIEETCRKIAGFFGEQKLSYEIIVVDDGSRDNTAGILEGCMKKDPALKVLQNEINRGKGYSVKRGILEASGGFILFTDADLSTPLEESDKLLGFLQKGFDVAIGSRALPGSDVRVHQPFYREYSGRIFNFMVRLMTSIGLKDTQCGFKCFRKNAAKNIFSRQTLDGFSFDVEDLYIAKKLGYRIKEVPVVWLNSGSTTVSFIKDAIQMFTDLLRIRINDHRGKYN
ncbi:MAG: glycosyltransferase family 2 protein [Candidatus Altiarchaeota archaeon]|nr:glycosyltransferase family 2 protein [Candidatus Altiarchaeota archaeon]